MRRAGMVCADSLPEIAGAPVFLAQQPGGGMGVDAPVAQHGVGRDAHCGQILEMYRVDLKTAQIPCAVFVAQGFAHSAAFRGKNGEERGNRHPADAGGVQNAVSRQGMQGRERDFHALCAQGKARRQAKGKQEDADRPHLIFPLRWRM